MGNKNSSGKHNYNSPYYKFDNVEKVHKNCKMLNSKDTRKEIEKKRKIIEQLQQLLHTEKQHLNQLWMLQGIHNFKSMEYAPDDASKESYDDMIVIKKYLRHNSKGKYLFKVPTYEYLKFLGWKEVANYDWIQSILINNPTTRLIDENKNIRLKELVIKGEYHCGQFDQKNKLHGFGFKILSKGEVWQGVFIHGNIHKSNQIAGLTLIQEEEYVFMDQKLNSGRYWRCVDKDGMEEMYENTISEKNYERAIREQGKPFGFYSGDIEL